MQNIIRPKKNILILRKSKACGPGDFPPAVFGKILEKCKAKFRLWGKVDKWNAWERMWKTLWKL
ncbi:MAG: hypothetical protein E7503_07890 [Ruminococcus sp.]|nr:hypothetical protein [Ruminococcus sp.]